MNKHTDQQYVQDRLGFWHPIEAVQQTIQSLKQHRSHIAQSPMSNAERKVFLEGIDAAITERKAMIQQVTNGKE